MRIYCRHVWFVCIPSDAQAALHAWAHVHRSVRRKFHVIMPDEFQFSSGLFFLLIFFWVILVVDSFDPVGSDM